MVDAVALHELAKKKFRGDSPALRYIGKVNREGYGLMTRCDCVAPKLSALLDKPYDGPIATTVDLRLTREMGQFLFMGCCPRCDTVYWAILE